MADSYYDYVIIGSGFGGSVSAMRLAEKGYSVLVLEKGKRFEDKDFAKSNWQYWKYVWIPALRAHGILQIIHPQRRDGLAWRRRGRRQSRLCQRS
jgi:cholesterol oxidase